MTSENGSASPVVTELKVTLDMEDRIESGNNIVSGTGTKSITFVQTYVTVPALGFAVQNMASGDTRQLTRDGIAKGLECVIEDVNSRTLSRALTALLRDGVLSQPSHGLYEVKSPEMDM